MPSSISSLQLPSPEIKYLEALTATLQLELSTSVKAVYLFGSPCYNAYEQGKSDLDVCVIIADSLPISTYQTLITKINHAVLPCPARKLELVIYTLITVNKMTRFPKFELNFNTGINMEDHLTFSAENEAGHWFLLDLAAGRELGNALVGPPADDLIGEINPEWVLNALHESLKWWGDNQATNPDAVLNACRGWRWAWERIWCGKEDGGKWVLTSTDSGPVVAIVCKALEARSRGEALEKTEMEAFLKFAAVQLLRKP